jgi:hypothetical protein
VNRRFKILYGLGLNKCGIKLAFNLSSTKPKQARLTYVHQQLMLNKISKYVIARYITSSSMAITK